MRKKCSSRHYILRMPRSARIVAVGVPHHVTQRGNHRAPIFFSQDHRAFYLKLLAEYATRFHLEVLGYCLMTNHVHLIVVPHRHDSLARGIGRTHNEYSLWVQLRKRQSGHLFQGRFASSPMDDAHCWRALLYTELNPVRAGLAPQATEYRWSSARAHAGLQPAPDWLSMPWFTHRHSTEGWQEVLRVGFREHGELERLREALRTGRPLGSDDFIDELERKLGRTLRPKGGTALPPGVNWAAGVHGA
jgi:putative transposase